MALSRVRNLTQALAYSWLSSVRSTLYSVGYSLYLTLNQLDLKINFKIQKKISNLQLVLVGKPKPTQ